MEKIIALGDGWRPHPRPHLVQHDLWRCAESIVNFPGKQRGPAMPSHDARTILDRDVTNGPIREHYSAPHRQKKMGLGRRPRVTHDNRPQRSGLIAGSRPEETSCARRFGGSGAMTLTKPYMS